MRTKIVAGFPGIGKTIFCKKYPDMALDSDSSFFSWMKDENGNNTNQRNPIFPTNYINHIKQNIGQYEFIMVSTHLSVREALLDNCLFFYYVMPDYHKKNEFLKRYLDRANHQTFIKMLDDNWDIFHKEFNETRRGCHKIIMTEDFLENELLKLKES